MRILCLNPGPPQVERHRLFVKEGRCMERSGAWSNIRMPITLAYISSFLKQEGNEVEIIDDTAMQYIGRPINLSKLLERFQPDLVVINTSIPTVFSEDMAAARLIKEHNCKEAPLVAMIGVAPTLVPEKIVESGFVDIAVRNEPEITVGEIVRTLVNGGAWESLDGITYKKNGLVKSNPDSTFLQDLDELPKPDFDSLPLDAYKTPIDNARQVLINVSRGCPNECIYCVGTIFYGKNFRCRDPVRVVEEMEYVYKLGAKKVLFWADTFTWSHSFVKRLCNEIIERGIEQKLSWVVNSRVDKADPKLFMLMKEAGCFLVAFGVESGCQEILNYARKGIKLQQTRDAFRWMRESGMASAAHVVFGLAPFENKKSIMKTMEFVRELNPDYANFHLATPYPKTPLHELYRKGGFIISEDLSLYESKRSNIALPELDAAELEYWRGKAFRDFYLRAEVMLRELKNIRSPKEFVNLIDNLLWFTQGWIFKRD